ncbi:helix-turn-helix domain-containing protein [Weissella confusa]|uniref:helix-turn-helix domain-containing protein n=1 Tax=Weissella confusa TaxID=1583 RepID=UPI00107F153F|nr:helix-turn-helix domain-containing protein [Weissella confusa]MBJ7630894.1 hypothetical protein [Weissella confusa]MBJ7635155.1 hypothetical protein [Weissella confusa]TGE44916.1 hypothetical protein C6P26_04515 [Weissella confusa]TGE56009.1 hypothetical protein C6P20_04480 [Weissella confusa]
MYQYLLPPVKIKRLELLHHLVSGKNLNVKSLARDLDLTPSGVRRLVDVLNQEAYVLFSEPNFFIFDDIGFIKINDVDTKLDKHKCFQTIKLTYLQQSPIFRLLHEFGINPVHKVINLEDRLAYSTSYIYRLIHRTNKFLTQFGFEIQEVDARKYAITGDLLCVRFFYYVLFADSFQTLNWPFEDVTKGANLETMEMGSEYKTASSQLILMTYWSTLHKSHRASKFLSYSVTSDINQVLSMFERDRGFYDQNVEDGYLFHFFKHLVVSTSFDFDRKVALGKSFAESDNFICQTAQKLPQQLIGDADENAAYYANYVFVLIILLSKLSGGKMLKILEIGFPFPEFYQVQENDLTTHVEMVVNTTLHKMNDVSLIPATEVLINAGLTIMLMNTNPQLNVFLQLSRTFTAHRLVENELKKFVNPNTVRIVSSIEEADFVITDTFEHQHNQRPIFFFQHFHSVDEWKKLISAINEELLFRAFNG